MSLFKYTQVAINNQSLYNELAKMFKVESQNLEVEAVDFIKQYSEEPNSFYLTHDSSYPSFTFPVYAPNTGKVLVDGRPFTSKRTSDIINNNKANEALILAKLEREWQENSKSLVNFVSVPCATVFTYWGSTAIERVNSLSPVSSAILQTILFMFNTLQFRLEDVSESWLVKTIADNFKLPPKAVQGFLSLQEVDGKSEETLYEVFSKYNSKEVKVTSSFKDTYEKCLKQFFDIANSNGYYLPVISYNELLLTLSRSGWNKDGLVFSTGAVEYPPFLMYLIYLSHKVSFYKKTGIGNATHVASRVKRGVLDQLIKKIESL